MPGTIIEFNPANSVLKCGHCGTSPCLLNSLHDEDLPLPVGLGSLGGGVLLEGEGVEGVVQVGMVALDPLEVGLLCLQQQTQLFSNFIDLLGPHSQLMRILIRYY